MESLINIGIILTYLMIGSAALTAIGFGIKKMMANTENAKKTLYTIKDYLPTSATLQMKMKFQIFLIK